MMYESKITTFLPHVFTSLYEDIAIEPAKYNLSIILGRHKRGNLLNVTDCPGGKKKN